MQHAATDCKRMQHTTLLLGMGWLRLVGSLKLQVSFAEYCLFYRALLQKRPIFLRSLLIVATPECFITSHNTLQHTAPYCTTLHHTAPHCTTLQPTAPHCPTLHRTAPHCTALHHTAPHCTTLRHTAPHCTTLQHIAAHCNTLQHTATYCTTLQNIAR